jgi:hypothetical protein
MKMMKNSAVSKTLFPLLIIMLLISVSFRSIVTAQPKQEYYEIKIYRLKDPGKNVIIDRYLKDAFIPAMHRAGINGIGVFKPVEADTAYGRMIYVFIPYKTLEQYDKVFSALGKDAVYQKAGKEFLDAPYNDPPFSRYESVFMKAFAKMPQFRVPVFTTPRSERIYELRSYESATEEKALKKIKMFNDGGEIGIFESIKANAVFYGQVLFGSQKPRLMYLTTYSDMKSQAAHWDAFRNHPDWVTLKAREEYLNSTSKTSAFLLHPTDYSDF